MRELDLPDPPTFQPHWPLPAADAPAAAGASLDGLDVRERVAAAASTILGAAPAAPKLPERRPPWGAFWAQILFHPEAQKTWSFTMMLLSQKYKCIGRSQLQGLVVSCIHFQ